MANDETRRRVAHLLRRAGFGATAEELDRYAAQGLEATVDELIEVERIPDTLDETLRQIDGGLLDLSTLDDAQTWWLYRMIETKRPLQEKMALFWHGHFATANYKVNNPALMHRQNQLFRAHALGNVQTLVLEVSKDPAMLIWLDGNTNRKAAPNENYARELMELFTLGVGHYGEEDVKEVARAFTGWNLTNPYQQEMMRGGDQGMAPGQEMTPGQAMQPPPVSRGRRAMQSFQFNPGQHDQGQKTILGRAGRWNGDDAIGIILAQPAHPTFLATRLFTFFAYDDPEPEVIAPLARVYRDSRYELKPLLRALFLAEAFSSEQAYTRHVKSPVEYVVTSIRALDLPVRARSLLPLLAAMGQELYNPPHVGGWAGGLAWLNPSTLLARFAFATRLTALTGQPPAEGGLFDVGALIGRLNLTSWEKAVDTLIATFTDRPPTPALKAALLAYVAGAALDPRTVDVKLRGLVQLIMTTAEAQTS